MTQEQLKEMLKEANRDVDKVKENVAINMVGIDDAIEKTALGGFTWVAYDREVIVNGTPAIRKEYAPAPIIMTAGHGVGKTGLSRNFAFSIG